MNYLLSISNPDGKNNHDQGAVSSVQRTVLFSIVKEGDRDCSKIGNEGRWGKNPP